MMKDIYYKLHQILLIGYLVMALDGRGTEIEGRTDMEKTISLRLRRGIISPVASEKIILLTFRDLGQRFNNVSNL